MNGATHNRLTVSAQPRQAWSDGASSAPAKRGG